MSGNASELVPDAALVARFSARLDQLWPKRGDDARLALAVSGGPDSTAMLLLAAAALPNRVEAATVDHRLRAESAAEALAVAHLCERLGLPHRTLQVEVATGSVQARAREARYAALAQWMEARGLHALATAHHADDQAETLLLRLNRASGVAGLAGVRASSVVPGTSLPLVRPLLDWRRADLQAIVDKAAVIAADDASNRDPRFDRVRMREALASADWIDIGAVATSAANIADADDALSWAARREWSECVRRDGPGLSYSPRSPRAIALRVLARMVVEMGEAEPRGGAVARIFNAMLSGEPASIGDLVVRPLHGAWVITKSPRPRKAR